MDSEILIWILIALGIWGEVIFFWASLFPGSFIKQALDDKLLNKLRGRDKKVLEIREILGDLQ